MIFLKILLIATFIVIFWQDYKERLVYWFLYPLVGILGFFIQKEYLDVTMILVNSAVNLSFVVIILSVLWIYSRLVLKQKLVNHGIGIGDILFFIFLAFCFSIITFFVLFVFSLLFSLLLHFVLNRKKLNDKSIPLAGYMSAFFAFVYGISLFVDSNFIFAY